MNEAGWWVGIGGIVSSLGIAGAWVLTWYVEKYRKQLVAEAQVQTTERRTDDETGYQRLSALFDSQQARLRRQGRGIAKIRKRCNDAEKNEVRCNERLSIMEEQIKELKADVLGTQKEQLRLLSEQNKQLDVLVSETQAQTSLQVDSALDKVLKGPDETTKGA